MKKIMYRSAREIEESNTKRIKIRSESGASLGDKEECFILYLERGKEIFNCAFPKSCLKTGFSAYRTLTAALSELIIKAFPDFEISRLEEELKDVNRHRNFLMEEIKKTKKELEHVAKTPSVGLGARDTL